MEIAGRALLALALALYLTIPASLLTAMGIPYDAPGGSLLVKFHPGTWVLVLALVMLSGRNPVRGLAQTLRAHWLLGIQLGCMGLLLAYTLARYGSSGSAFILETLITIPLALMAIACLDEAARRRLSLLIMVFLAANSVLAAGEALLGERLMPHTVAGGVDIPDLHFRATALLGHPLNNAMITAPAVLLALGMKGMWRWLLPALLMTGLLAFGGRTAFVAAAGLAGLVLAARASSAVLHRRWSYAALVGGSLLVVLACGTIVGIVAISGLGERIFANPLWDDSAQVRVTSWQALEYMSIDDIMFGMSPDAIETVIFRLGLNYPIETIESFWLLMLMQFGAVGLVPFIGGGLAGAAYLWNRTDTLGRLALLLFLAVASSNNSLAAKTPAAALVFAAIALHRFSFRNAANKVGSVHPF